MFETTETVTTGIVELTEHEFMRRELWCNAWVATAKSSNCVAHKTCTTFADVALREFDMRFKAPKELVNAQT
jgi:hypothetical protein